MIKLNYDVEVIAIPLEDGGGYQASIPYLGSLAFRGDGETIQEAIDNLNKITEYLFLEYIKKGILNSKKE